MIETLCIVEIRAPVGPGAGAGARQAARLAGVEAVVDAADAHLVFMRNVVIPASELPRTPLLVVRFDESGVSTPLLHPRNVAAWLARCGAKVVGVVGALEEDEPGIGEFVAHYLADVMRYANDSNPAPPGPGPPVRTKSPLDHPGTRLDDGRWRG